MANSENVEVSAHPCSPAIPFTVRLRTVRKYTSARVFVLRIRVSCAFPTRCTCVEFKLRMKRESTYFETHEYSLAAL